MTTTAQRSATELETCLEQILEAPQDTGIIEMIVRRPAENQREIVEIGELDPEQGLVGDDWVNRTGADGIPSREAQLTLMSSRVIDAVAGARERWSLAGDQVYVDLDLSQANLPPGTLLQIGEATIRISDKPHTGCAKFAARFGKDALRFVNVGLGAAHRFRGVNASIIAGGRIRPGDTVAKKV